MRNDFLHWNEVMGDDGKAEIISLSRDMLDLDEYLHESGVDTLITDADLLKAVIGMRIIDELDGIIECINRK